MMLFIFSNARLNNPTFKLIKTSITHQTVSVVLFLKKAIPAGISIIQARIKLATLSPLAETLGLEPRITESKSVVLPITLCLYLLIK